VGAPFFLREREDTLRVFTYAPHDEKIRRLVAAASAAKSRRPGGGTWTKERSAYIKHYFQCGMADAPLIT